MHNILDVCDMQDLVPIIIGLSAYVDENIESQTKQVGMTMCLEAPLHADLIEVHIFQLLTQREVRISKLQMINYKLAKLSKFMKNEPINKSFSFSNASCFSMSDFPNK